jgi:hypothetical protein
MMNSIFQRVTPTKADATKDKPPTVNPAPEGDIEVLEDADMPKKKRSTTQSTLSYVAAATASTIIANDTPKTPTTPRKRKSPSSKGAQQAKLKAIAIGNKPTPKAAASLIGLATKSWIRKKIALKVLKEANGTPKNLNTDGSDWIQGDDICAAGLQCCVRKSQKLNLDNWCATCGWCVHEECGLSFKQTKKQEKDKIFAPTDTIKSICLLCITINPSKSIKKARRRNIFLRSMKMSSNSLRSTGEQLNFVASWKHKNLLLLPNQTLLLLQPNRPRSTPTQTRRTRNVPSRLLEPKTLPRRTRLWQPPQA